MISHQITNSLLLKLFKIFMVVLICVFLIFSMCLNIFMVSFFVFCYPIDVFNGDFSCIYYCNTHIINCDVNSHHKKLKFIHLNATMLDMDTIVKTFNLAIIVLKWNATSLLKQVLCWNVFYVFFFFISHRCSQVLFCEHWVRYHWSFVFLC